MSEFAIALALASFAVLMCVVGLIGTGRGLRPWLTAIGGCMLLGMTSFGLMPALDERTALRATNALLREATARAKPVATGDLKQCEDNERALTAAQVREQKIVDAIRRIPVAVRVQPGEIDPLIVSESAGAARLEAIVAAITQIDGLLTRRAQPMETQVASLRQRLTTGISNDYFVIEPAGQDLVDGHRGDYYRIKFKSGERGWALDFPTGQYVLEPTAKRTVEQGAEQLVAEVLGQIPTGIARMLYIRGNATALPWDRGAFVAGHEYDEIAVIPGSATKGYKFGVSCYRTSRPPHNEDLPNLRAAFVQSVLGRIRGIGLPAVLQGRAADRLPEANETEVEIFLRVEW